jgi:regulator of protease activity HflC (stomatin/prohibitin superfamily)
MNEISVGIPFFGWLAAAGLVAVVLKTFFVNVGPDEIAITERKYIGKELKPGRVFATEGEVGINIHYLAPGLHFVFWPFIQLVARTKMVSIGANEIGLIESLDGEALPAGSIFADDPAAEFHKQFQEPVQFLRSGGIRGKQLSFLTNGVFKIHPYLFKVSKAPVVSIGADELGIVEATDGAPLAAGRIFADDPAGDSHDNFQNPVSFLKNGGVRGKQLRFLTNGTFRIHPDLFKVTKIKKTHIPEGKIGVVTAMEGSPLRVGQLLGASIDGHDNFQKPENFLKSGGEKGPQIDFLRPGTYNINTEVFKVEVRDAIRILETEIGIVEAKDGQPMLRDEVVVKTPDSHNNFQDGQKFLVNGGKRGPQEAVLTPGTYYINPYLFSVSKRKQTVVAQGEVAVMISNIGKDPEEYLPEATAAGSAAGAQEEKHKTRHVVPKGFRGIQRDVLGPGFYNINPLAYSVVIVPTVTRSVDWSGEKGGATSFDPFQVVSFDGFPMQVEVRCQYRILPENAPYVVQKLGSITELEANVLHPQIDGIFRAQVSRSPAIAYQQNRAEEQKSASEAVKEDLVKYRVEVVSVMITNIHLPEALMKTTQQKNLAEQEKSMYDSKQEAEKRRIEFEKTRAEADSQVKIITAEAGIKVAQHEARQTEERAKGDASKVRMLAEAEASRIKQVGDSEASIVQAKGEAQAKAYRDQVDALTAQGVTSVEIMKAISAAGLKITPDVQVVGGGGSGDSGLVQLLLADMLRRGGPSPNA